MQLLSGLVLIEKGNTIALSLKEVYEYLDKITLIGILQMDVCMDFQDQRFSNT